MHCMPMTLLLYLLNFNNISLVHESFVALYLRPQNLYLVNDV